MVVHVVMLVVVLVGWVQVVVVVLWPAQQVVEVGRLGVLLGCRE